MSSSLQGRDYFWRPDALGAKALNCGGSGAKGSIYKVSAASAAHAILDGLEQGLEAIYPDPFAVEYRDTYAVNPKGLEERIAALSAAD
jgi:hypothetical protein